MSARFLAASLLASWLAAASAAEPPAPADPAAGARKLKRGSAEENAAFEKRKLPVRRPVKAVKKGKGVSSLAAAAPAAGAPAPKAAADPAEVFLEYELEADAEVSLSLMAPDGSQARQFEIAPGLAGGRKGANRLPWDGRDAAGKLAAPGEYMAVLTIVYHRDGEPPAPATLLVPVARKAP